MRLESRWSFRKMAWRGAALPLFLLAALALSLPLAAQQPQGPLALPPNLPANRMPPSRPAPTPQPAPKPARTTQEEVHKTYPIVHEPPSTPVNQIIQDFAQHEAEFKIARDGFTYTRKFLVETINDEGQPDGQYTMTSDITFTPSGQRFVKITDAPQPTLTRISLSEQDLEDLRNVQPFVLTTKDLPEYNVTYVGRQRVDYLHTYVFDVGPKKIKKHHQYFKGRIWVDIHDLEIVKTEGKAVPDITKGSYQNLFPRFTTYRKNILGEYWFPVYTYADDVLHFDTGNVHIKMFIWWTNYKRFRVSVKLFKANQPNEPNQPKKK